tara:strand:+ start:2035 stop:2301 length:267 start_codon:yes stop_codon:yes gene_type:complete
MKGLAFICLTLTTLSFSISANDNDPIVQAFASYKECVKSIFSQTKKAKRSFVLNKVCNVQRQNLLQLLPAESKQDIENAIKKMVEVMS